jgi:hypothetical protein
MAKGIRDFAEVVALSERSRAKERSPWFYLTLQGKGLVRQRSLSADLMFGYFASKVK